MILKIFEFTSFSHLERQFNAWATENPNVDIFKITIKSYYIAVFYKLPR